MKRIFLACLLPSLILACAAQRAPLPVPEALLREDPFDARYKVDCDTASGKTVCVMTGNALRPFNPRYPLLSLGLISEAGKSGPPRYFLRAVYVNEGRWLNLGPGGTLELTTDGETVALSGAGSRGSRYAGENGKLYEVALYEVSAALIGTIAGARAVSVRIKGDYLLEKSFSPINNLYFQQFIRHYIEKGPTAAR